MSEALKHEHVIHGVSSAMLGAMLSAMGEAVEAQNPGPHQAVEVQLSLTPPSAGGTTSFSSVSVKVVDVQLPDSRSGVASLEELEALEAEQTKEAISEKVPEV